LPRKKITLENTIDSLSILDEKGKVDKKLEPKLSKDDLLKLFRAMPFSFGFEASSSLLVVSMLCTGMYAAAIPLGRTKPSWLMLRRNVPDCASNRSTRRFHFDVAATMTVPSSLRYAASESVLAISMPREVHDWARSVQ